MPDSGHGPGERSLQRLRTLQAAGRKHARALPAQQVRELGARRHRRRVVATVAAASVALVVFAGGVLLATEQLVVTSDRQPADTVEPELPRSVLLRAAETDYHERGDFVVAQTVHGEGDNFVSVCQRAPLSSLGAVDVWRRDFRFRSGGAAMLRWAVMQFRDEGSAAQALQTLTGWMDQCADAVASAGFDRFSDRGRWFDVDGSDAAATGTDVVARFRTGMAYGPVPGDEFGELFYYHDQGVVRSGDRVALVSLVVPGQDWNWAYDERVAEQTGLPLNPMFTMLEETQANIGH